MYKIRLSSGYYLAYQGETLLFTLKTALSLRNTFTEPIDIILA